MDSVSLMQFLRDYLAATLMWAVLGISLVAGVALAWRAWELVLMRAPADRSRPWISTQLPSADLRDR